MNHKMNNKIQVVLYNLTYKILFSFISLYCYLIILLGRCFITPILLRKEKSWDQVSWSEGFNTTTFLNSGISLLNSLWIYQILALFILPFYFRFSEFISYWILNVEASNLETQSFLWIYCNYKKINWCKSHSYLYISYFKD